MPVQRRLPAILLLAAFVCGCGEKPSELERAAADIREGRSEQTEARLQALVKKHPENFDTAAALAYILVKKGELRKAVEVLNRAELSLPAVDRAAYEMLRADLARTEVSLPPLDEPTYCRSDMAYARACMQTHRLAVRIAAGTEDDRVITARLFDWTYRNVPKWSSRPKVGDYDALPCEILSRGYGCCDRSAWVFCALAEQLGLPANVVYLIDLENKATNHSVAEVYAGGRWVVLDTYQGVAFPGEDGSLSSIEDLAARPEATKRYPFYDANLRKQFEYAAIWVPAEPPAVFLRMRALEKAWRGIGFRARLYADPYARIVRRIEDLSAGGRKKHPVRLWFYPFRLCESVSAERPQKIRASEKEAMGEALRGRHLYLSGHLAEAIAALPRDTEDGLYTLGLAGLEGGDPRTAAAIFRDLIRRFPETRWKTPALVHIGRAMELLGDYAAALDTYRSIAEQDGNLMNRIEILQKKPELLRRCALMPSLGVRVLANE